MEDFSSLIWIVAFVGAMLFSASSKARKQAREAARKAMRELGENAPRHEAWPSWDIPQASESDAATRKQVPAMDYHPETVPASTSRTDTRQESACDDPLLRMEETDFGHGAFGTDGDTDAKSPSGSGPKRVKNRNNQPQTDLHASGNDTSAEELAAEMREEFDLRRAVIYSEILKPKFDD